MNRADLRAAVGQRLGSRCVVFFGIRGDDAEAVGDLPNLERVFSVVAAPSTRHWIDALALEDLTGQRVDLDRYDIDDDASPKITLFRRTILSSLLRESVVFTYRPSHFLSAICFIRQDRCMYAGLFKDHQAAFEHKPWVESCTRALGIPTLSWVYIADEDKLQTLKYLDNGPVILRTSRSSGGTGFIKLDDARDLERAWPAQGEHFVSVAPYISGGIPVNVSGVAWRDGLTLHVPTVQLIGLPSCTTRPFGYCGNDAAAIRSIDPRLIERMESYTLQIGNWMRSLGYVGAFGVDFLITDGEVRFTEVNPRMQGVTHLACQIAAAANHSCVMLEHLAACLGIDAPSFIPLRHQVAECPEWSHVVLHWLGPSPHVVDAAGVQDETREWKAVRRADAAADGGLTVDPLGTVLRLTLNGRLTESGFDLLPPWSDRLTRVSKQYLGRST